MRLRGPTLTLVFRALLVVALGGMLAPLALDSKTASANRDGATVKTPLLRMTDFGQLPMSFVANHGQTDDKVKFIARGAGYSLFLTATEAVLSLQSRTDEMAAVRMRLVSANATPHISGVEELSGTSNYFLGNDPAKWQRDVPNYAKVQYEAVYPGIDLVFYGNQRQLEFDLIVAPHADPSLIALAFEGVKGRSIDESGNLILNTAAGSIVQHKPVIYQDIGGRRQPVDGGYALLANEEIAFRIADYDVSQPLVIDPVMLYSTYLGGAGHDVGYAIAVDTAGGVYITGETRSLNFPGTSGSPIQSTIAGATDVFVTKLNAAGAALVYSTYLGGNDGDWGIAIAVDSAGSAYLTGRTFSSTFPAMNAIQPNSGGLWDTFITKINPTGNTLVYSTYYGGSGSDGGYDIAVDPSGNAYITGETDSTVGFPIVAAFQPHNGGESDAFVAKISAAGTALVYSTFLGGKGREGFPFEGAIAVDGAGNAYVGGTTGSTNFPSANRSAIQSAHGGWYFDGFVVKFNPSGSALVYSTYLGGDLSDIVSDLDVDASGSAYVTGFTNSSNFPTVAALRATRNGTGADHDAFVARINSDGSALVYSTYLGGEGSDDASAISIDSASNVYVAGRTGSSNFATAQPLQVARGGDFDAFVSVLNAAGDRLLFSTYWGGKSNDGAAGVAVDSVGNVFVTGWTNSADFPTRNALQPEYGSPIGDPMGFRADAFVLKIAPLPFPPTLQAPTNLAVASVAGQAVTLTWHAPTGGIVPTGYAVEGGTQPGDVLATLPTGSTATNHSFIAPTGAFYVRVRALNGLVNGPASNEVRLFVNVAPPPSAPTNLLAVVNGSSVALAWTNTATGGAPSALIFDVTGTLSLSLPIPVSHSFSMANVPAGRYTIWVRATNASGTSTSSNGVTVTVPATCSGPPQTPTNFDVSKAGNVVTAMWSLPTSGPAPTSYTLPISGAFTSVLSTTERRLSGAAGPGTYTVQVAATNACGTSAPTAPLTVTIP